LNLLKNPPLLKKSPNMPKSRQVEKRPGSVESDSFGVGGHFWWCFQVLLFDHLGFFSRIESLALTPMAHITPRQQRFDPRPKPVGYFPGLDCRHGEIMAEARINVTSLFTDKL
jgi:hypothetical protein